MIAVSTEFRTQGLVEIGEGSGCRGLSKLEEQVVNLI